MTTDRPLSLLYVCTANICRSAYADVLTRHLAGDRDDLRVSSAGTQGFTDREMDPPMAEELTRRGGDAGEFRSRRLTMSMVSAADLVLTMESRHRQFVLDERPELYRRVLTLGQLSRMLDRTDPEVTGRALVDSLRDRFLVAEPTDDVADPYGRGPEAAATAARQIDQHVRRIVGALTGETMEVS
jgi:sulfate adenylyltransferase